MDELPLDANVTLIRFALIRFVMFLFLVLSYTCLALTVSNSTTLSDPRQEKIEMNKAD